MRISCALVLALAACGGGGTSTKPTTPTNTQPPPGPVADAAPAAVENDSSICASRPDEFGPIQLDAAHAAHRRGRDVTKFSAAQSSKDKPLEVCGVGQQQQWLMAATCDDGSRPYQDRRQIAESRRGNVGMGGTCGTIIDLYVATCPEKEYEVYLDMYHCGPGESFM